MEPKGPHSEVKVFGKLSVICSETPLSLPHLAMCTNIAAMVSEKGLQDGLMYYSLVKRGRH